MAIHFLWIIAMFFILAVIAAFVVAVVLIARPNPAPPVQAGRGAPLDILAQRFAKGEITAEEYQKARDLLKS